MPIIGICGGFQMLGIAIQDPYGIENNGVPISEDGLGLLPIRTVLRREKTVRCVSGFLRGNFFRAGVSKQAPFQGYEIHVGETLYETEASPLTDLQHQGATAPVPDGAVSKSGRVFGTYVHGFFDRDDFRHKFLRAARAAVNLAPATAYVTSTTERNARMDRLARHLRKSLNMRLLKSWIIDPRQRVSENHRG